MLSILPHRVSFSVRFVLVRLLQHNLVPAAWLKWVESSERFRQLSLTFNMGEMLIVARKSRSVWADLGSTGRSG
jgi:hypothetical protein